MMWMDGLDQADKQIFDKIPTFEIIKGHSAFENAQSLHKARREQKWQPWQLLLFLLLPLSFRSGMVLISPSGAPGAPGKSGVRLADWRQVAEAISAPNCGVFSPTLIGQADPIAQFSQLASYRTFFDISVCIEGTWSSPPSKFGRPSSDDHHHNDSVSTLSRIFLPSWIITEFEHHFRALQNPQGRPSCRLRCWL